MIHSLEVTPTLPGRSDRIEENVSRLSHLSQIGAAAGNCASLSPPKNSKGESALGDEYAKVNSIGKPRGFEDKDGVSDARFMLKQSIQPYLNHEDGESLKPHGTTLGNLNVNNDAGKPDTRLSLMGESFIGSESAEEYLTRLSSKFQKQHHETLFRDSLRISVQSRTLSRKEPRKPEPSKKYKKGIPPPGTGSGKERWVAPVTANDTADSDKNEEPSLSRFLYADEEVRGGALAMPEQLRPLDSPSTLDEARLDKGRTQNGIHCLPLTILSPQGLVGTSLISSCPRIDRENHTMLSNDNSAVKPMTWAMARSLAAINDRAGEGLLAPFRVNCMDASASATNVILKPPSHGAQGMTRWGLREELEKKLTGEGAMGRHYQQVGVIKGQNSTNEHIVSREFSLSNLNHSMCDANGTMTDLYSPISRNYDEYKPSIPHRVVLLRPPTPSPQRPSEQREGGLEKGDAPSENDEKRYVKPPPNGGGHLEQEPQTTEANITGINTDVVRSRKISPPSSAKFGSPEAKTLQNTVPVRAERTPKSGYPNAGFGNFPSGPLFSPAKDPVQTHTINNTREDACEEKSIKGHFDTVDEFSRSDFSLGFPVPSSLNDEKETNRGSYQVPCRGGPTSVSFSASQDSPSPSAECAPAPQFFTSLLQSSILRPSPTVNSVITENEHMAHLVPNEVPSHIPVIRASQSLGPNSVEGFHRQGKESHEADREPTQPHAVSRTPTKGSAVNGAIHQTYHAAKSGSIPGFVPSKAESYTSSTSETPAISPNIPFLSSERVHHALRTVDSKEETQSEDVYCLGSVADSVASNTDQENDILRKALEVANLSAYRRQVECEELHSVCDELQGQLQDAIGRETYYQSRIMHLTEALEATIATRMEPFPQLFPTTPSQDPITQPCSVATPADEKRFASLQEERSDEWRNRYDQLLVELCTLKTVVAEQKAVLDRLGLHPPYREEMVGTACLMMMGLRPLDSVKNTP